MRVRTLFTIILTLTVVSCATAPQTDTPISGLMPTIANAYGRTDIGNVTPTPELAIALERLGARLDETFNAVDARLGEDAAAATAEKYADDLFDLAWSIESDAAMKGDLSEFRTRLSRRPFAGYLFRDGLFTDQERKWLIDEAREIERKHKVAP